MGQNIFYAQSVVRCSTRKPHKKLEADNKAVKDEKPVVPRFVLDRHGAPRQNEDYRRQIKCSRPKTFIPPTDVSWEKCIESVNQKEGKKPKWRVLEKETTSPEKKSGYTISPNYKGNNPMTRTQWRRHQRNKKAGKVVTTPQLKPSETAGQKEQMPKVVGPRKMVANQTVAMIVDSMGKKAVITT